MPLSSLHADIDIPVVDLWTLYLENPKPYPDDHRKFPPFNFHPLEKLTYPALLIDADTGRSYNRAQIRAQSIRFGQGLKHLFGWAKGDVLAFFTPNCVDTPVVNLGLHWAAGVASPANPTYTVDELARQLRDARAKALITQTSVLDAALQAADKAGLPRDRVLLMGDGRHQGFRHWTDVTAKGAWLAPKKTPVDATKDLAYLVYSSVGQRMFT